MNAIRNVFYIKRTHEKYVYYCDYYSAPPNWTKEPPPPSKKVSNLKKNVHTDTCARCTKDPPSPVDTVLLNLYYNIILLVLLLWWLHLSTTMWIDFTDICSDEIKVDSINEQLKLFLLINMYQYICQEGHLFNCIKNVFCFWLINLCVLSVAHSIGDSKSTIEIKILYLLLSHRYAWWSINPRFSEAPEGVIYSHP